MGKFKEKDIEKRFGSILGDVEPPMYRNTTVLSFKGSKMTEQEVFKIRVKRYLTKLTKNSNLKVVVKGDKK